MSVTKEYDKKIEREERDWQIKQLIEAYTVYLGEMTPYQIESIYHSDSFELRARIL